MFSCKKITFSVTTSTCSPEFKLRFVVVCLLLLLLCPLFNSVILLNSMDTVLHFARLNVPNDLRKFGPLCCPLTSRNSVT